MDNEILSAIKHTKYIKEISKKKVTLAKVESFAQKIKIEITTDKLNRVMETMVNKGVTQREGEKESITRIFLGQSENQVVVASDTLKPSPVDTSKVMVVVVIFPQKDDEQESAVPDAGNSIKFDTMISILKHVNYLKKFQEPVERIFLIWRKL